jgi:hypothetical protein
MPSPFPGMNPYLEQDDAWHDFHKSFMPAAAALIAAQVAPRYFVRMEKRGYRHRLSAEQRLFLDAVRESRLAVRDCRTREVVTVIELLSPANKQPGPDREQYLAKRLQFLHSAVHFVEIDLLRGGERFPPANATPSAYCVLVSRMQERPEAGLWPIALRDRLPVIPIPLSSPDPDARLDLQEVIHRVYDAAHYGTYVYAAAPDPPLSAADAAWARELVPGLA